MIYKLRLAELLQLIENSLNIADDTFCAMVANIVNRTAKALQYEVPVDPYAKESIPLCMNFRIRKSDFRKAGHLRLVCDRGAIAAINLFPRLGHPKAALHDIHEALHIVSPLGVRHEKAIRRNVATGPMHEKIGSHTVLLSSWFNCDLYRQPVGRLQAVVDVDAVGDKRVKFEHAARALHSWKAPLQWLHPLHSRLE